MTEPMTPTVSNEPRRTVSTSSNAGHITVGRFPPDYAVPDVTQDVTPGNCDDCGGLGCDDCCFTGHSDVRERGTQMYSNGGRHRMDEIRERHVKAGCECGNPEHDFCEECYGDWPCDARKALDALDADVADNLRVRDAAARYRDQRDAARADAARLAEALRLVKQWRMADLWGVPMTTINEALRQHDAVIPPGITDEEHTRE